MRGGIAANPRMIFHGTPISPSSAAIALMVICLPSAASTALASVRKAAMCLPRHAFRFGDLEQLLCAGVLGAMVRMPESGQRLLGRLVRRDDLACLGVGVGCRDDLLEVTSDLLLHTAELAAHAEYPRGDCTLNGIGRTHIDHPRANRTEWAN